MSYKYISKGAEARSKLISGAQKLSEAVAVTYGALGRNVLSYISDGRTTPRITKDGVSVAQEIVLQDNIEDAAALTLKVAAKKTAEAAGDGTTATIVLANSILKNGADLITQEKMEPISLQNSLNELLDELIEKVESISIPANDPDVLKNVAYISTNGDKELSELVSRVTSEIGSNGLFFVNDSTSQHTTVEIVNGMMIDQGYFSPYFVNNPKKNECVLKDVFIFIYDEKIHTANQIPYFLQKFKKTYPTSSLLMIAKDFSLDCVSARLNDHLKDNLKCCLIKCPEPEAFKYELLSDIAVLTGGRVISERSGFKTLLLEHGKNIEMEFLGYAEEVVIGANRTIIRGACPSKEIGEDNTTIRTKTESQELKDRVLALKEELESLKDRDDIELMKKRIANLSSGMAAVFVGGHTRVQISEKKDRVEDALFACQAAMKKGVVPGGGRVFTFLADYIKSKYIDHPNSHFYNMICDSFESLEKQLCWNAGISWDEINKERNRGEDYKLGINLITRKVENLIEAGVLDPVVVIQEVLKNSFSVSGTLLTTEVVITVPQKPDSVILNQLDLTSITEVAKSVKEII